MKNKREIETWKNLKSFKDLKYKNLDTYKKTIDA